MLQKLYNKPPAKTAPEITLGLTEIKPEFNGAAEPLLGRVRIVCDEAATKGALRDREGKPISAALYRRRSQRTPPADVFAAVGAFALHRSDVTAFPISLQRFAHQFRGGHRIGLQVAQVDELYVPSVL